jgi:hypothetical protein
MFGLRRRDEAARECECEYEYGDVRAETGVMRLVRTVRFVLPVSVLSADTNGAESMRQ